jgi:hypothetical protein
MESSPVTTHINEGTTTTPLLGSVELVHILGPSVWVALRPWHVNFGIILAHDAAVRTDSQLLEAWGFEVGALSSYVVNFVLEDCYLPTYLPSIRFFRALPLLMFLSTDTFY